MDITKPLIITGDFNIHVDIPTDRKSYIFTALITSFGLHQIVRVSTHIKGHILDLVIVDKLTKFLLEESKITLKIDITVKSDHYAVVFPLPLTGKLKPVEKTVTTRSWQKVERTAFITTVNEIIESTPAASSRDADVLASTLMHALQGAADIHAPPKRYKIALHPSCPYYNNNLRELKRRRRALERRLSGTKAPLLENQYRQLRKVERRAHDIAQKEWYKKKFIDIGSDTRALSKFFKTQFSNHSADILPVHDDSQTLANSFNSFFILKVENLVAEIAQMNTTAAGVSVQTNNHIHAIAPPRWSVFDQQVQAKVLKTIHSCANKHSFLDPMPTNILKRMSELVQPITNVINASLASGVFPDIFKTAIVRPTIKKSNLDQNNFANYRPISNLLFLSKVLEKTVHVQYMAHINANNLSDSHQSAYRTMHSTETAMVSVTNDILRSLDAKLVVLLVTLDYSSAFDLVPHEKLLATLHNFHGVSGTTLAWFESYLANRKQAVLIKDAVSDVLPVNVGVPQGSILGGSLFAAFVQPLSHVIRSHLVSYHVYADDHQLYISTRPEFLESARRRMEKCVEAVQHWSAINGLKLNPSKTEVLLFSSPGANTVTTPIALTISQQTIAATEKVCDLGVILDSSLSLKDHVIKLCKKGYFALHQIKRVQPFIDKKTVIQLLTWHTLSIVDYCSILLFGLPDCSLKPISKLLNCCVRLVFKLSYSDHDLTPYFKELQWLKVHERLKFKLLVLVFKCLHNLAPPYLSRLFESHNTSVNLRSQSTCSLHVPHVKSTYGSRAFYFQGTILWNSLPILVKNCDNLYSFKRLLKQHLLSTM